MLTATLTAALCSHGLATGSPMQCSPSCWLPPGTMPCGPSCASGYRTMQYLPSTRAPAAHLGLPSPLDTRQSMAYTSPSSNSTSSTCQIEQRSNVQQLLPHGPAPLFIGPMGLVGWEGSQAGRLLRLPLSCTQTCRQAAATSQSVPPRPPKHLPPHPQPTAQVRNLQPRPRTHLLVGLRLVHHRLLRVNHKASHLVRHHAVHQAAQSGGCGEVLGWKGITITPVHQAAQGQNQEDGGRLSVGRAGGVPGNTRACSRACRQGMREVATGVLQGQTGPGGVAGMATCNPGLGKTPLQVTPPGEMQGAALMRRGAARKRAEL